MNHLEQLLLELVTMHLLSNMIHLEMLHGLQRLVVHLMRGLEYRLTVKTMFLQQGILAGLQHSIILMDHRVQFLLQLPLMHLL